MTASRPDAPWRAGTVALSWGVTGLLLVLLGLISGRPLVVTLGMPLVIGTAWSWSQRPRGIADVTIDDSRYRSETGQVEGDLRIVPTTGLATTNLRIGSSAHRPVDVLVDSTRGRSLRLSVSGTRTGRRSVFTAVYLQAGLDQITRLDPESLGPIDVTVLPRTVPLGRLPLPFRLQGLTGAHDSRRIGDGGEFHDISLFAPGDRLRRIDWRVTARRVGQDRESAPGITQLYVRRSHATADAVVILVIDSRDEIGPDVATWASGRPVHPEDPTSLDIAREAAGSLARTYLEAGDRVGVIDLGRTSRALRPAGGRRHLQRVLHQLAGANPEGEPARRVRAPQVPSGAMIVMFSTFLDDEPMKLGEMWRAAGHRVLAIDVIPRPELDRLRTREQLAYRIIELERQDRFWQLSGAGVEVVPWSVTEGEGASALVHGLATAARRRDGRR